MTELVEAGAAHNPRCDRALALARSKYAVFPLRPDGSKAPYADDAVSAALGVPPPPKGMGGCKLATSDPVAVERLWSVYPDAWIGIATGAASGGLIVLDSDEKNNKSGSATLQARQLPLPNTAWQRTAGGGVHYLYRAASGSHCPTDANVIGDGLDRRGDGGYIVDYNFDLTVPPSLAPPWLMGGAGNRADRKPLGTDRSPSFDLARKALFGVDNPDDYEGWRNVGMAFRQSATGLADEATIRAAFDEWCAQSEKNDKADNDKLWRSADGGTAIGWDYLRKATAGPIQAEIMFGSTILSIQNPPNTLQSDVSMFMRAADMTYREPEFHIAEMIETDSMALLFGDPGSGKSFIALDMACCVATGHSFHGRPASKGPVFYIAGEGHNGLRRRMNAWEVCHGISLAEAPLFVSRTAVQFLTPGSGEAVRAAVVGLVEINGPPRLIVIDTLARNFGPGDENSQKDMGSFIAILDELRSAFPSSTVLIVHHSGHGDKDRGRG